MNQIYHFAEELQKIAMNISIPKIPLGKAGVLSHSGAGVRASETARGVLSASGKSLAVKAPVKMPLNLAASKISPVADGRNLGTKLSPRTRTVPSAEYGGSLIS